jgi:hypothetical protein
VRWLRRAPKGDVGYFTLKGSIVSSSVEVEERLTFALMYITSRVIKNDINETMRS